jgi:UDP-N-acetylglucosamine/UDP-N-acetylgalactosamine diphosphorylase
MAFSELGSYEVLYVHAYYVDNYLARVATLSLSVTVIASRMTAPLKSSKAHETSAVGVVAQPDGKYGVVEYSEITASQAAGRGLARGDLHFCTCKIMNHFYITAFLRGVASFRDDLAFHIIRKKDPPYIPSRSGGVQADQVECDEAGDVRL